MVLEKLGNSLKDTLQKIAKSVFVDEKLINELVKDIQRALLQADVNVKLVFDLTKSIKQRITDEKTPSGLSKKEHLINIVYDELVKFLGGEKEEIKIPKKRPLKIMMIGLFGSGKCVHADTNIQFSDGNILTAKNIYDQFDQKKQKKIKDVEGTIIDVSNEDLLVPSFNPNTLEIENKKITHLWKLQGKRLLDVYLDNGNDYSVRVTPEHPFFVLRKGDLKQVRADQLNEDDFVAVPNKYCATKYGAIIDLFPLLKNIDLDIRVGNLDLFSSDQTLKEICKGLKFKRNYCKFTSKLKKGVIPIVLFDDLNQPNLNIKSKNSRKFINFPRFLTAELAEFMGYIFGDGHVDKAYLQFSNEDPEIIKRIASLSCSLFGIKPTVKRDTKTKSMYDVRISSVTLVRIFERLFNLGPGKKGKNLTIPETILKSSDETVKLFLRAYFDCDAHVLKKARQIEITSESIPLINQVNMVLMRFGIFSTKSRKYINKIPYGRLNIRARYAESYAEKIGFMVRHKDETAKKYKSMGLRQGCGKQDMVPLARGLLELRESLGYSLGEIQNQVVSYGNYEKKGLISSESLARVCDYYSKTKSGIIFDIISKIKNKNLTGYPQCVLNTVTHRLRQLDLVHTSEEGIVLTSDGNRLFASVSRHNKLEALSFFNCLADSDVCWIRVSRVMNCQSQEKFVYDFTVEDNHSFVADGMIVHNTTQSGKLAKFYSKRGYKVAILGLDVHRPAAMTQVEQIGKKVKVPFFIEKGEKDPKKIYEKYKDELKNFDIVLVDTAGRDALSDDLIEEIEGLTKLVEPQEKLLVISADIGQAAQKQSEQFHKSCGITGVVATKMDGTAKAGGALTACSVTESPIKFIGVGEGMDDLEEFNPQGFVGRLLGMGDIEALLDKAKGAISEEDAEDLGKRMLKGEFNLIDLYEQMAAMKKMGSLGKIVEMIPGFGQLKLPKELLDVQESKLEKWKYIMDSCTKGELEDPEMIDGERAERIAKGSGLKVSEVRELVKQYRQSKKMMKMMKGSPDKMMKKFQKGGLPGMGGMKLK